MPLSHLTQYKLVCPITGYLGSAEQVLFLLFCPDPLFVCIDPSIHLFCLLVVRSTRKRTPVAISKQLKSIIKNIHLFSIAILDNASLDKTSTKKVIQKLEQKLGVDLSEKKKLIDQLVMDYVNNMDSEEEESESEEEPPKKKPVLRKAKKQDDDEDDEEHDDSNDSDWGVSKSYTMVSIGQHHWVL